MGPHCCLWAVPRGLQQSLPVLGGAAEWGSEPLETSLPPVLWTLGAFPYGWRLFENQFSHRVLSFLASSALALHPTSPRAQEQPRLKWQERGGGPGARPPLYFPFLQVHPGVPPPPLPGLSRTSRRHGYQEVPERQHKPQNWQGTSSRSRLCAPPLHLSPHPLSPNFLSPCSRPPSLSQFPLSDQSWTLLSPPPSTRSFLPASSTKDWLLCSGHGDSSSYRKSKTVHLPCQSVPVGTGASQEHGPLWPRWPLRITLQHLRAHSPHKAVSGPCSWTPFLPLRIRTDPCHPQVDWCPYQPGKSGIRPQGNRGCSPWSHSQQL